MTRCPTAILAAGLWVALQGCADRSTEPLQGDRRTGLDRVRAEAVFGNEDAVTGVFDIERDGSGALFFYGIVNNDTVAGGLTAGGEPAWTTTNTQRPTHIMPAPVPSAGVIVSAWDPELSVYAGDGTKVHELDLDDSRRSVWLNAAAITTVGAQGATIVAVGGKRVKGVMHPVVLSIDLSPSGQLTATADTVLLDFPDTAFRHIVADTSGPSPIYYVVHSTYAAWDDPLHSSVRALSQSLETLWERDFTDIPGRSPFIAGICLSDDGVAVVGRSYFEKSDGYESTAVLSRFFERDGTVRWTIARALSDIHDAYWDCAVAGNEVLAVGSLSGFLRPSTTRVFGFGLLSRIDIATGDFAGHLVLGDPEYFSALYGVSLAQGTAHCVGTTEAFIRDGGSRGWYLEVDLSSSAAWQLDSEIAHTSPP